MRIIAILLCLCCITTTRAQLIVNDPANMAQGIVNSSKNLVYSATTAANVLKAYEESKKIYEQGKKVYDALNSINNLIQDSYKVKYTIDMIIEISDIYSEGFAKLQNDELFNPEEITAIAYGYTRLLQESSNTLNSLKEVVSIASFSMSDKERMEMVDDLYKEVMGYRNLVSYFTNKHLAVSYLRWQKIEDAARITALYGSDSDKYW